MITPGPIVITIAVVAIAVNCLVSLYRAVTHDAECRSIISISRPKGGKGASDSVTDVLVSPWHMPSTRILWKVYFG